MSNTYVVLDLEAGLWQGDRRSGWLKIRFTSLFLLNITRRGRLKVFVSPEQSIVIPVIDRWSLIVILHWVSAVSVPRKVGVVRWYRLVMKEISWTWIIDEFFSLSCTWSREVRFRPEVMQYLIANKAVRNSFLECLLGLSWLRKLSGWLVFGRIGVCGGCMWWFVLTPLLLRC